MFILELLQPFKDPCWNGRSTLHDHLGYDVILAPTASLLIRGPCFDDWLPLVAPGLRHRRVGHSVDEVDAVGLDHVQAHDNSPQILGPSISKNQAGARRLFWR